jgi:hypothetical protein
VFEMTITIEAGGTNVQAKRVSSVPSTLFLMGGAYMTFVVWAGCDLLNAS